MHDMNGRLLKVGDEVLVPCLVKSVGGDEAFCSCTVETSEVMPGNGTRSSLTLSTRQVLAGRVEKYPSGPRYANNAPMTCAPPA